MPTNMHRILAAHRTDTHHVLLLQVGIDLGLGLAGIKLALGVVAALLVQDIVLGDGLALLAAEGLTVVGLVPLWCSRAGGYGRDKGDESVRKKH